jgi:hypothetical protein
MEMSNITSSLSELVPGVSCTNVTMASVERDEIVVTSSNDENGNHQDHEERCHLQELKVSIKGVAENAKMEMSNITSSLTELVPGVSCTNIIMASAEKDEFVVTSSNDNDSDHQDHEEQSHLQEPKVSEQASVQQEAITTAGKAALVVHPPEEDLLDLNAEPTGHATVSAAAVPAAPPAVVQEDLMDLTEVAPAPVMALSPGDLAGLDMGQAVASNPAPDMQLLDLSLAEEPVTSNAVPSHNHDLLDLDQSWTQTTNTAAAASENIPRLDRPSVSSCSMAALLPGNAGHQAEALLA